MANGKDQPSGLSYPEINLSRFVFAKCTSHAESQTRLSANRYTNPLSRLPTATTVTTTTLSLT